MPVADSVKLLNTRLSDPLSKKILLQIFGKNLLRQNTLSSNAFTPQYFSESSTFVIEAGEAYG